MTFTIFQNPSSTRTILPPPTPPNSTGHHSLWATITDITKRVFSGTTDRTPVSTAQQTTDRILAPAIQEAIENLTNRLLQSSHHQENAVPLFWAIYHTPQDQRERVCDLTLTFLQNSPEADVYEFYRFIRALPHNQRESICQLVLIWLPTVPEKMVYYFLENIKITPQDQREQICNLILFLLQVLLKFLPRINTDFFFAAIRDTPENQRESICKFTLPLLKASPETDFYCLFEAIRNTPENQRESICELTLLLLQASSNDVNAQFIFTSLENTPANQRGQICELTLSLLHALPHTDSCYLFEAIRDIPKNQRERICTFALSYLERHPDANLKECISQANNAKNSYNEFSLQGSREVLPLLTPKQIKATVEAATQEEIDKAFNQTFHLEVSNDSGLLQEMLEAGTKYLIEDGKIDIEGVEGMDLMGRCTLTPETLRETVQFLDRIPPFTLALAAKNSTLQPLVLRYLYPMHNRHLAVVLPFIPADKLQAAVQDLQKQGFNTEHIEGVTIQE